MYVDAPASERLMLWLKFTSRYQDIGRDWKDDNIFLKFPRDDALHIDR